MPPISRTDALTMWSGRGFSNADRVCAFRKSAPQSIKAWGMDSMSPALQWEKCWTQFVAQTTPKLLSSKPNSQIVQRNGPIDSATNHRGRIFASR